MINNRFALTRYAVLLSLVGALTPGAARAIASGTLLTNFVSASFQLPSGYPGTNYKGISQTSWILITDNPSLCMQSWKQATNIVGTPMALTGTPPMPEAFAQTDFVCFTVSFSNCGGYSGFSVAITDVMPENTVRGAAMPGSVFARGGYGSASALWALSLAGPWLSTDPVGQVGPLYLRWVLDHVGMHKTGYVRYCLTVL